MTGQQSSITLSASMSLTMPAEEGAFAMRISDWKRLRGRVNRLKQQRREFAAAAWAFVGITVSAGFGLLSWMATWRVLSGAQRTDLAWMYPLLWVLLVAGACLSVGAFYGAHLMKNIAVETVNDLARDMDSINDISDLIAS